MDLRLDNPMPPDDVFDTTLICLAEISANILRDRNKGNANRIYRRVECCNCGHEWTVDKRS